MDKRHTLIRDARVFFDFGWLLGTSGNLSFRTGGQFTITRSGAHKGELTDADFVRCAVDDARPLEDKKPSAETAIHALIYRTFPSVGAVYHVHQVHAAICGRIDGDKTTFQGWEMIKGLGFWEENVAVDVPIVENHADIPTLTDAIESVLDRCEVPGVNIAGHGIYAWGETPFDARRHIETFGYLFEAQYLLNRN